MMVCDSVWARGLVVASFTAATLVFAGIDLSASRGAEAAQPSSTARNGADAPRGDDAVSPPPLEVESVEPDDALNALFTRTDGWTGADGAYSVALSPERSLWLFSDTWVGKVRDGKRTDAKMVNNSVAVQEMGTAEDGRRITRSVSFIVARGPEGKPQALITPADGRGWFWLQAGVVVDGRMYLFLAQVERSGKQGVFGFRTVGHWLGVVSNPNDDPAAWRVEQHRVPHEVVSPERQFTFGTAVLRHGEHVYIYGADEDIRPRGKDRYLAVARAPAGRLAEFDAWEFYGEKGWQPDFRQSHRAVPDMASESSVSYLPERRQFVLVYTAGGMSKRILARAAAEPWGPWSEPVTVYECPEAEWDRRVFCYAAKAHPWLSSEDELVVTYATNSFDIRHVVADARLYWPRFVRVRLKPLATME